MKSSLFLILILICPFATAENSNDKSQQVVIAGIKSTPTLGPEWNEATKKEFYGGDPVNGFEKMMSIIAYETPLSALSIVTETVTSNFSKQAPTIAKKCKELHPNQAWVQIGCAARSVKATFSEHKWSNLSTFCRAHANAFNEVFKELNIPKSNSFQLREGRKGRPHVINRITVTDESGFTHKYAIDVGWDPYQVFPIGNTRKDELAKITFKQPTHDFHPETKSCTKPPFSKNLKTLTTILNPKNIQ